MKTWSYWSNPEKDTITGSCGEEPPRFADGRIDPDCTVLLYRIQAETYEEAVAIHHLRMGWEPYKPAGDPKPCPKCGSIFYPEGSGDCWKCGA